MSMNEFLVGTANFGQPYGLDKTRQGLAREDIVEILSLLDSLTRAGIDTAPDYGRSEEILGEVISQINVSSKITTKIPMANYYSSDRTVDAVRGSLKRLQVSAVDTILFHGYSNDFVEHSGVLRESSKRILDLGLAKKVGLTCYSEEEIVKGKEMVPELSVFQVPENVLDQRLCKSTQLVNLQNDGCIFYLRSIFLQGLLLIDTENFEGISENWRRQLKIFERKAEACGLSRTAYCIAYAKSIPWASGIVVGTESVRQLKEFIVLYSHSYENLSFDLEPGSIDLIDPRRWTTQT